MSVTPEQAQVSHGCCKPTRVGKDLRILDKLGIEEGVLLVELSCLLQHCHLLDQALQGQLLRTLRNVRICPDANSLGEVASTDVADHGRSHIKRLL